MARMKPPHVPDVPVPVLGDDELRRLLAAGEGSGFEERRDTAILRLFLDSGMPNYAPMSSCVANLLICMETKRITASTTLEADSSAHADIDGTGWVGGSLDGDRITAAGHVFRMGYHEHHSDKAYRISNRVEAFDEPRAIPWQPGRSRPRPGNSASVAGSGATTSRRPARRGRR